MAESIRPYRHYKRQVIINDQYLQREHFVNTYIYIFFLRYLNITIKN